MKISKIEVLAGMTALCFIILLIPTVMDGVTPQELIPIMIQIFGTLLAVATLMVERDIRIAEVKVKEGELGIKQAEAERIDDEWQSKRSVKYAKIRGRLLTWLASGPDADIPVDAAMLDSLRAHIAGQTELLEAYPPLAHLVAKLEQAIQWDITIGGSDHDHIESIVRKMEKDLRPEEE